MAITRDENQIVFESKGGDPDVVVGDGSTRSLELNKKASIVFGGFSSGQQHRYCRPSEKASEERFIANLLIATVKAGFHFRQDNQRDLDFVAEREPVGECGIALKEVGQPIGIEGDPHFHLSQSI